MATANSLTTVQSNKPQSKTPGCMKKYAGVVTDWSSRKNDDGKDEHISAGEQTLTQHRKQALLNTTHNKNQLVLDILMQNITFKFFP